MPIETFDSLTTTASLQLPEGYVVVLKADIEKLEKQIGRGEWKDIKWFKEKVGIKNSEKIDDLILRPFREELDAENGGFVHYPEGKGDPWAFLKSETEAWLDINFSRIFRNK